MQTLKNGVYIRPSRQPKRVAMVKLWHIVIEAEYI